MPYEFCVKIFKQQEIPKTREMSSNLRVLIDYDEGDHFFNDSSNRPPLLQTRV